MYIMVAGLIQNKKNVPHEKSFGISRGRSGPINLRRFLPSKSPHFLDVDFHGLHDVPETKFRWPCCRPG